MTEYDQKACIESESLAKMRNDANRVLQKLLKNMVEKSTNEGTLTIRLDVSFIQEFVPIPLEEQTEKSGETRRVLKPQFKHKISSTMQVKDDASGDSINDTMELVWDEETCSYVLTPVKGERQMNIFDVMKDQEPDTEETDTEETEDNDQKQINGKTFLALPSPDGDEVIDGDFREVDDSDDSDDMNPPEEDDSFGGYEYQEPGDEEEDKEWD